MKKLAKILVLPFLMVALVGGVWLTKNNQDIRKHAAIAPAYTSIYPTNTTVTLGKPVKIHVYLNTGGGEGLLVGAEFQVKYGSGLKYSGHEILIKDYSVLNTTIDDGKGTLTFKVVSMGTEKGGALDFMTITFDSTGVATGSITTTNTKLMINGQNAMLDVKIDESGTYKITSSGSITPILTPDGPMKCSIRPGAPVVGCPSGYTCECTCCPEPGLVGCAQYDVCRKIVSTVTPSVKPTVKPTEILVNDGVLKFKITFAGVNSAANCAKNWNVNVTVMEKNNKMNLFNNVPLTIGETKANGLLVYSGQVSLKGVATRDNLAIFIKSPKHIQTKYGVNGQSTFYGKSGGEIKVEDSSLKTTIQDFTGYPMLAGDVVGDNGQDGVVNGLDFAFIKNEVIKRSEGDNMLADLNGNCKLESQDLSLLMQTLREKVDQIY